MTNRGFFSNPNADNSVNNPNVQIKKKKASHISTAQNTRGLGGISSNTGVTIASTTTTTTLSTSTTTTTTTATVVFYPSVLFIGATSSNYTYFVYGGDGVATRTFDTGVSTSGYSYSIYPVQDSGYMLLFVGSELNILQFIDSYGNIIQQSTLSNTGSNWNTLSMLYSYYYYTSGSDIIFYYFDGTNVYTYVFTGASSLSIGSYYDHTMDKGFVIRATVGSTTTWYCADGLGNMNQLFVEQSGYGYYLETYNYGPGIYNENEVGNFIVNNVYNTNTEYYDRIEILSKTGTVIKSISISNLNIDSYEDQFLGYNLYSVIYFMSSGGYYIVYYDGNRNVILTKTISNVYNNFNWSDWDGVITYYLYDATGGYYNNYFSYYNYLSFLPIYIGDSSISNPTPINSGSNTIGVQYSYNSITNNYTVLFLEEGGYLHQLILSKNGNTDTTLNIQASDLTSYIGGGSTTKVAFDLISTTASTFITYGVTGSVVNYTQIDSDGVSYAYVGYGDMTLLIYDYNNNVSYHSNAGNNYQITADDFVYNDYYNINYDNFYYIGNFLSFDSDTYNARYIDTASVYNNISMSFLGSSISHDIGLCDDFIIVVYSDSGTNWYIKTYDFNGNILQSISVGYFGFGGGIDWRSLNLAVCYFYDGSNYTYYLISKNSYTITINGDYHINNYYWWDY
jgi:hypothetical protein